MTKQKPTPHNAPTSIIDCSGSAMLTNSFAPARPQNLSQNPTIDEMNRFLVSGKNITPISTSASESKEGRHHLDGERTQLAIRIARDRVRLSPAGFANQKDWSNDDFRTVIQHWNSLHTEQTPKAIDEADAALFNAASIPKTETEIRRRTRVSEAVYLGLRTVLLRFRYSGFNLSCAWGGDTAHITTCTDVGTDELPEWLRLDCLRIEYYTPPEPCESPDCTCDLCSRRKLELE